MNIIICVKMYKADKDGNKKEASLHFNRGARLILRENESDIAYDASLKKIWKNLWIRLDFRECETLIREYCQV